MFRVLTLAVSIIAGLAVETVNADAGHARISITGDSRCIRSDGRPNHSTGTFPRRGNPNRIRKQDLSVCVDATPELTGRVVDRTNASGISLTGVLFRPNTAEYFDPSSHRNFSRDRTSGWQVEGMGAADQLGMDQHNAHVDHRGLYHYHAPATALTQSMDGTLIGYAADGFEIHYAPQSVQSSWQLKSGQRPNGPRGAYDGTYVQDWKYVRSSGNLDECNGAKINGQYVYFATDSYPFFPRCFKGTVSQDFLRRR